LIVCDLPFFKDIEAFLRQIGKCAAMVFDVGKELHNFDVRFEGAAGSSGVPAATSPSGAAVAGGGLSGFCANSDAGGKSATRKQWR